MGKKSLFLVISAGISGVLFYLIFSQNTWGQWTRLLSRIRTDLLGLYAGLYLIGLLIRTVRYRLLLKGAGTDRVPAFGNLVLVTSVRNMLVDLLPARSGSLSYLVILNRVFAVDLSACLTSFTYAALFDLLTLGPLLAVVLLIDTLQGTPAHPALWGLGIMVTVGGLFVIAFLEPLFRGLSPWIEGRTVSFRKGRPWSEKIIQELMEVSRSFLTLRRARLFWPLLGLSLLLRTIKYTLLYLLLFAVMTALLEVRPFPAFSKNHVRDNGLGGGCQPAGQRDCRVWIVRGDTGDGAGRSGNSGLPGDIYFLCHAPVVADFRIQPGKRSADHHRDRLVAVRGRHS